MNTMNPYLKQYQKNQVETATPEQVLILLYDGAINFLSKSKVALDEDNDNDFQKYMLKCRDIIAEFMDTLDLEQGGDWALSLFKLYKYLRQVIVKSSVTKDVEGINEVQRHLTNLRNTWIEAIKIAKEEGTLSRTQHSEKLSFSQDAESYYHGKHDSEEYDTEDDDEEDDDESEYDEEI